jgi:molybdenum cofactor cytidylyltransferase
MTVAAILLAAGESARMGVPKPLLGWEGRTLVEYQIEQLRLAGVDTVVAVLGHQANDVGPLAERAGATVVVNEAYREGRASSLRAGAGALPDETRTIVVLSVDQPRQHEVLRRLTDEHAVGGKRITVPTFEGRRGHPPVLDGSLLQEMREVREETKGLREILLGHRDEINEVDLESDTVLLDLNDPQDYEAARATSKKRVV